MKAKSFSLLLIFVFLSSLLWGNWPSYKGNLYFTGNNDELIVKSHEVKWAFSASSKIFYPAVSDNKVYFLDQESTLYCLHQETGEFIFKAPLPKLSGRFRSSSRVSGKVKALLIQGPVVLVTGSDMIYAFNKNNGMLFWARPGMDESTLTSTISMDGVYSAPLIVENKIFYGTRKTFMARDLNNGHIVWKNEEIQSWNGFPGFYGSFILAQSRNYQKNETKLYTLDAKTGTCLWSFTLETPLEILPPAVYDQKVYIPLSKSLYCLDLNTGRLLWKQEYSFFITSPLSFTENVILLTGDNSFVQVVCPKTGNLLSSIDLPYKSGPYHVVVRDQIYVVYNSYDNPLKETPFGYVKAFNFDSKELLWEFKASEEGSVSQPVAAGGVLFFPSGKNLYALGEPPVFPKLLVNNDQNQTLNNKEENREITLTLEDEQGKKITGIVEIITKENNKEVSKKILNLSQSNKINLSSNQDSEILIHSKDFLPKKVFIKKEEDEKKVTLQKLELEKPLTIEEIYFETNQAYLKKESLDVLSSLVEIIHKNPSLKVEIRGHTDNTGSDSYNQKLSQRRADAVLDYLIKQGILPHRLKSLGFGKDKPVASNDTPEGRAKNRRTEFYFTR